jgi:Flp pilus assembly CpaF family ATPase
MLVRDILEAKPTFDSRLPDGGQVAVVIPPCSKHGVGLAIRKLNSHKFRMEDNSDLGTVATELAEQLKE